MKTKDFDSKKSFDFRGLKCPLPVLKTKRALKEVKEGEIIAVLADDPAANLDLKHFCEVSGNILIKITNEKNIINCLIQKNSN
ncbi:MAG: sulfurtransferase TusA family protein [Candidatus Puniceispirillales bacterium]